MKIIFKACLLILLIKPVLVYADNYLLYLEAQGIGGYSFKNDKIVYDSLTPKDAMQKSSLGFDYIKKLSNDNGDFGTLALQGRLAWDKDSHPVLEPQLYNAYFKYKARWTDLWVGHNRPAFGLSSYFDTHALLLPTLVMYGFGYDRDWGVGSYRDFSWGNASFSTSLGSGMTTRFNNNYLLSGRISKGVLEQENYNLGLSVAYGHVLDAMGYTIMSNKKLDFKAIDIDFTYFYNNIENRTELMFGVRDKNFGAAFNRTTLNLTEKFKLEGQVIGYTSRGSTEMSMDDSGQVLIANRDLILSLGTTYLFSENLAWRIMYNHPTKFSDNAIVMQLYYYKKM